MHTKLLFGGLLLGAFAFAGCASHQCKMHAEKAAPPRPVRAEKATPPALDDSNIERLVARALDVAVVRDSVLNPEKRVLVLNTVVVCHPPDPGVLKLLTPAVLPQSQQKELLLVSRREVDDAPPGKDLHWVEVEYVIITGDDARVDVLFWSISSYARAGLVVSGAAEGPILLFRRTGGDWTFVEVKTWHHVN